MVPPKETPQVPSVVCLPVGAASAATTGVGLPRTGSPEVVEEGGLVAEVMTGMEVTTDPVHPFWQPLAGRQWPAVAPQ